MYGNNQYANPNQGYGMTTSAPSQNSNQYYQNNQQGYGYSN